MSTCRRCRQNTNGPQAFLLTCQGCSETWHHRCHMPPVEDDELMQRLRATNAGDENNGVHAWTCRRCKKAFSTTPSATSSREPTVSSESRNDPSTTETRAKGEQSAGVNRRPLAEQRRKDDRQESADAAPVERIPSAKRTAPSAPKSLYAQHSTSPSQSRDPDVLMRDVTPTPQGEKRSLERSSPQVSSNQGMGVQRCVKPASVPEDNVNTRVDVLFSEPTPNVTCRAPHVSSSDNNNQAIRTTSVAQVPSQAASSTDKQIRTDEAATQPQVNRDAEDDDDPEDLYGPPVERRIIRILPSLAEELREQQRRAAAEKERRRAPLAPDWILARHVHDPLWKDIRAMVGGQKRPKPIARKLGDNGLNVSELVGYLACRNAVRAHVT